MVDKKNKVTIITVVYNDASAISQTIESVLRQDYEFIQYIVMDGGSNDGTQGVIEKLHSEIDLYVSEPDRGIYDAMNKGMSHASGDLILFMNSGDIFASDNIISDMMGVARATGEQAIFGAWIRKEASGSRIDRTPDLRAGLFNHQAILYSRSLHNRFGPYVAVPGLTTADYLFFTTVIASGSVDCITFDRPVAVIDVGGISAGNQTLSQKFAVDYLYGRTTRITLAAVLLLHPLFRRIKRAFGR